MTEFNITYQSAHGTAPEAKAVEAVGIDSGYSLYNGLELPTLDPAYNWMIFGGPGLTEVTQVETEFGTFDMLYFAVPTTSPTIIVFDGGEVSIQDEAIRPESVRVFGQDGDYITEVTEFSTTLYFSINGLCSGEYVLDVDDGWLCFYEGGCPPLYWTNDSELQSEFLDQLKIISCWGTSATKEGSSGGGGGGGGSSAYYTPYVCEIAEPETVYDGYAYTLTADDLPILTADNATFKGWTLADGTFVSVGDMVFGDVTLVAEWEVKVEEMSTGKKFLLYRLFPEIFAKALIEKGGTSTPTTKSILLSSDGYMLQDANGLYLIPNEVN